MMMRTFVVLLLLTVASAKPSYQSSTSDDIPTISLSLSLPDTTIRQTFSRGNSKYGEPNVYVTKNEEASSSTFDRISIPTQISDQSIIKKYFYAYAPPQGFTEELKTETQELARHINYKIIFIKVPNYYKSPTIIQQQQNKEKTIVYVLVKQPEVAEKHRLVDQPQTPPSKPQVYFIKYVGSEKRDENVSEKYGKNVSEITESDNKPLLLNKFNPSAEDTLNSTFSPNIIISSTEEESIKNALDN